eukprot:Gb_09584 [translate_table: standard]
MDLLKKELQRKRQNLESDFGGRKFIKRSEIEQKKLDRIREEEQKELQKKLQKNKPSSDDPSQPNADDTPSTLHSSSKTSVKSKEEFGEEHKIDELVLSRPEVIRRLRFLKQPITLFGEDDDARLNRLKSLLKAGVVDPDNDMAEGQRNDFLIDLAELKKRQKTGLLHHKKDKSKEKDGIEEGEGRGVSDDHGGEGGSSGIDKDKDLKRLKSNFEDWEQELEDRPEAEKTTGRGKSMVATFKQCARYLKPLFKFCRKRCLPDDIRQALLVVVECCMKRDYLAAMDQYIKLAIGNAPWPIGVTMVGIHERSAREKIYTNSVAHIMNDETTRKYLQSIKRLMTLCQRRYPSLPSKSVEFNSLANGSDLQSLLSEEKLKTGSNIAEERLKLMTGPAETHSP